MHTVKQTNKKTQNRTDNHQKTTEMKSDCAYMNTKCAPESFVII